jgi:pyruvate,orthophosphate dikinase
MVAGFEMDSDLMVRSRAAIRYCADSADKEWGSDYLVSVRSGAAVSMPGMMDTILNVGFNDEMLESMPPERRQFALDSYRRLIEMYATTVHGADPIHFKKINEASLEWHAGDTEAERLDTVVRAYKKVFKEQIGWEFPQDPDVQLVGAINAVYNSWHSARAKAYRIKAGISDDIGTAVTIQGMKFGNLNSSSATGVVFSRNPNTGEPGWYGEYLVNAQGEDVVAGTHNAKPIYAMQNEIDLAGPSKRLKEITYQLDQEYGGVVDIEFTIEDGELWILQCRKGKITKRATLYIMAQHLVDSGSVPVMPGEIDDFVSEALALLEEASQQEEQQPVTGNFVSLPDRGKGVSHGVTVGRAAFTIEDVEKAKAEGYNYIWVATETSPNDTEQMIGACGLLTSTGSSVSHAAVCAREWGLPAVVGFAGMDIVHHAAYASGATIGWGPAVEAKFKYNISINNSDTIRIDGTTGEVSVLAADG